MGGFVVLAIFVFVVIAIVKASKGPSIATFDRLARSGVRGRALVLAASPRAQSKGTSTGMRRFEVRAMTLDVEVPGRAPFVAQGTYLVPRGLVEPTPGSSLEVAIDPRAEGQIAILGPGGFTGPWLNVGPPQPY